MTDKFVTLAHGAGGKQTSELIDRVFKEHFAYVKNIYLLKFDILIFKFQHFVLLSFLFLFIL